MKRVDKIVNAYQAGLKVGQLLMEATVESALRLEYGAAVLDGEKEKKVMQLLCSAGHLYYLLPESEYIHLLPIYFRGVGEEVPEIVVEYDRVSHTWYAKFFAWGFSIYVMDSLEEWDEWLFDHGYIGEDEYGERVENADGKENGDADKELLDDDCLNGSCYSCGLAPETAYAKKAEEREGRKREDDE